MLRTSDAGKRAPIVQLPRRQEAERAAWAAPGMRQVEDHLVIVS
jgi:hypothetical protein